MKRKFTFSIILISVFACSLALFGCEGPAGPQGSQGPQGEQGPQGPVGPAGDGGAVMLAGQGAPSQNTGNPGDFYIDLEAGNLYGPKTDQGWGSPLNLQGPPGQDGADGQDGQDGRDGVDGKDGQDGADGQDGQDGADGQDGQDGADGQDGQDGADGSQIYAGDGPPESSLGEVGDYYLDKENYHLYGPKTGSGWGSFLNLQGPPGTANVRYSNWIEIDWEGDDLAAKSFYISEPALTEELYETGVILVYLRPSEGVGISFMIPSTMEIVSYYYVFAPGAIQLRAFTLDDSEIEVDSITHVRYVLIPGGLPLKMQDGFWEDYEQVKNHFNIPD